MERTRKSCIIYDSFMHGGKDISEIENCGAKVADVSKSPAVF